MGRLLCFFIAIALSTNAHAWGKRGHAIVCETAAYLAAQKSKKSEFLKDHSFDLAYYCNVPDLVWKKGELYQKERHNHFMDMEIFARGLEGTRVEKPLELDRLSFEKAFPSISLDAGRAFWRTDELMKAAEEITIELKKPDLAREAKHKLQLAWLIHHGAIGHYVGDLAQPLHVTENYDGQLTDQKGLHAWFEDALVNDMYIGFDRKLVSEVMKDAELKFKKMSAGWENKSVVGILQDLTKESAAEVPKLLKIDKATGRKNEKKAMQAYHRMIVDRMSSGAVALSVLWIRGLGWDYDGNKFYDFSGEPQFIEQPQPATPQKPKSK